MKKSDEEDLLWLYKFYNKPYRYKYEHINLPSLPPSKLKNKRLTPEEWDTKYGHTERKWVIFEAQGHICAICSTDKPSPSYWNTWELDHCHITGKLRGVLCHKCNVDVDIVERGYRLWNIGKQIQIWAYLAKFK